MGKKVLLGGFSAILLVAAVVGVVAGVMRSHHKAGSDFSVPDSGDGLQTSSKSIQALCASTNYRQTCEQTLSVAVTNSSNPKEVVKAAVTAAISEVSSAFNLAHNLSQGVSDAGLQQALTDCKTLMEDATDSLTATVTAVTQLEGIQKRTNDVNTWLSAVLSYKETCIDGINHPELKDQMKTGLMNTTALTSIALSFVNFFTSVLEDLPDALKGAVSGNTHRRLMSVGEVDAQGYPKWFSASDRKLLAVHGAGRLVPNQVVAKDGSGQFKSIQAAINAMPKEYKGRWVIYVKAGIYDEQVLIDKSKANIFMYGDGARKSIVTGDKSFAHGVQTMHTSTFAVTAPGFIAKGMGFRNTAGPEGHQAVAYRSQSDMSALFQCRFDGYQDTLYTQANRQFFRNCVISGTIDFIFGDSTTYIQNCLIIVRRPMDNQQNTVTAHGRSGAEETTALVIHNCRIVPDMKLFPDRFKIPSYLGRPWKEYSTTVVMESKIGDLIRPEGWMPWQGDFALDTLYYAEYNNVGPGANTANRVKWGGVHRSLSRREALRFTAGPLMGGDSWLKYTGTPYLLGFRH